MRGTVYVLVISFLLGGCFPFTHPSTNQPSDAEDLDPFVSVQDYTGEGYTLDGGEETQPIADENLPEIEEAVKHFFKDEYKTDVVVHNVVGSINAATVYVEAVGEVPFYTFAIVPIDIKNEEVLGGQIWVREDQVEQAISGGIYSLIYEEEISNLNTYIEDFAERNNVLGFTDKALENVRGTGFSTPYYFIAFRNNEFEHLVELYLENPQWKAQEWQNQFERNTPDPTSFLITIQLFMGEHHSEPDEDIFHDFVSTFKEQERFPPSLYNIYLNDHKIDRTTGDGIKENSLRRANPNQLLKES